MAALLALCLCSCAPAAPAGRSFDGKRAYADLGRILEFGPREPGSAASASARAYIKREVEAAGLTLQDLPFVAQTPSELKRGPVNMVNLLAEVKGDQPGIILLSNHYDTKYFPDFKFLGANDGGSTTAWMIEMARALGPTRHGRTVWLCWFDGEEAYGEWSETDSLYGSRQMVSWLKTTGKFPELKAAINVDMIGDCKLDIIRDSAAPEWLFDAVLDAAKGLHPSPFSPIEQAIEDDHLPFRLAGIPALNLIDFRYGGTQADHQINWHTSRDKIDLVCAASLQTVGGMILRALPGIDAAFDRGDAGRE